MVEGRSPQKVKLIDYEGKSLANHWIIEVFIAGVIRRAFCVLLQLIKSIVGNSDDSLAKNRRVYITFLVADVLYQFDYQEHAFSLIQHQLD